jgi:hypothetical protein
MSEKIFEVAAWGKYIYRSYAERHHYEYKIQNDESVIRFYIYSSQWLASLYVVVEGWLSLKESDKAIDELLSVYEDYVLIIKRCRNAVYHYQKDIVDKRVEKAVTNQELITWAGALLDEFIRFLYIYPFNKHGICEETVHLQKEYLDLVGWTPNVGGWVEWYETFFFILQYYDGNNPEILTRTLQNDRKIEGVLKKLKSINANSYISMLSRIKANV